MVNPRPLSRAAVRDRKAARLRLIGHMGLALIAAGVIVLSLFALRH